MLSKIIRPGCKIELQALARFNDDPSDQSRKVYSSQVYDILSDDRMEIIMPMEQAKLVLLPVDSEYEALFYSETSAYQCFVKIVDRYRTNNVYILVIEMTSNLRKHQRREFYRFSCALEMAIRPLNEEETKAFTEKAVYEITPGIPMNRCVIVDLSGGGLRFMSNQKYEPESLIYCTYHLLTSGKNKEYEMVGKILTVKELDNKRGVYEHRVQYMNLGVEHREEIIKYIFEEERKNLRREKG